MTRRALGSSLSILNDSVAVKFLTKPCDSACSLSSFLRYVGRGITCHAYKVSPSTVSMEKGVTWFPFSEVSGQSPWETLHGQEGSFTDLQIPTALAGLCYARIEC